MNGSFINSAAYWEDRFLSQDWKTNHGPEQSLAFAQVAYDLMPDFLKHDLQTNQWTVVDLGCAEGDGTAHLAKLFPSCNFVGIDFSKAAIDQASKKYHNCTFKVVDIYKEIPEADVLFSSNVLEHLACPREIMSGAFSSHSKYIVYLLPLNDSTGIAEHINIFTEDFFPFEHENFYLRYHRIFDMSADVQLKSQWNGKQILLLYANRLYYPNQMTVADLRLGSDERRLHQQVDALQDRIEGLQKEADLWKEKATNYKTDSDTSKRQLVDTSQKLQEITQELRDALEENSSLCSNVQALQNASSQLDIEYTQTKRIVQSLRAANENLAQQIANIKNLVRYVCNDSLNSRPYRWAYFFHRTVQQGIRSPYTERKSYRRWLKAKLLHKHVDEDYTFNPFRKLLYAVSENQWDGADQESTTAALVAAPADAQELESEVRKAYKKRIPDLKNGAFTNYIAHEASWMNCLDQVTISESVINLLDSILDNTKYKGIIVYPATISWEPFQTPQQLLVSFANDGYLCIFCEKPGCEHKGLFLLHDNIWAVPEDVFLKVIGKRLVYVMLTWMGSVPFVEHIPNKKVWYHVLDHLDIFSLYDDSYLAMHNYVAHQCDWVSYVAKPLLACIQGRDDAIYLPNACHAEELIHTTAGDVPEDMQSIVELGEPIIGYFGWIAEWMDFDTVRRVALARPNYQFVMIGPADMSKEVVSVGIEKLKAIPNVHFLGRKKYEQLPAYAHRFNIGTVPFLINEMMDCVSPIKFYEYCAYGIPTITSYMPEMEGYACEFVACYRTVDEYLQLLDSFLTEKVQTKAKEAAPQLALENTWHNRTDTMASIFESSTDNASN